MSAYILLILAVQVSYLLASHEFLNDGVSIDLLICYVPSSEVNYNEIL